MKYLEQILNFKLIELGNFSLSVSNIVLIGIIFLGVKILLKGVEALINKRLSDKGGVKEGQGRSIVQIIKYIVYILASFVTIKSLGIDITIIGAFFATLGLGLGFALQELFRDVISGIVILFERNVKVGDILEVDNLVGNVKEIRLRTSVLRTRDGIYMVIPNSRIINEKVINWTANNKSTRFSVSVGVAYGSDVEKVKELLLKSVENHEKISTRPAPIVFFNDFGDSALLFELRFWTVETWAIEVTKSEIRFKINQLFRENNIQIPFPQRDVHVIQKINE
ncbi:mechanosensitive ion channel [Vicingus serpentipes]|jgi:small-conductance mechanosensitive channel|uniref:Mechanosensitive ion channel n=1 Tax=Vicingus serpentipes TaxID=1926625 RepID=A0A5C6RSG7_9FLAO|nr:mechanosensitive ion channel domain-containing protein [Vicingus serpentipes]TXB64580.1 mechanosensitive ion channel [Vicingus serpentipes]